MTYWTRCVAVRRASKRRCARCLCWGHRVADKLERHSIANYRFQSSPNPTLHLWVRFRLPWNQNPHDHADTSEGDDALAEGQSRGLIRSCLLGWWLIHIGNDRRFKAYPQLGCNIYCSWSPTLMIDISTFYSYTDLGIITGSPTQLQ